MLDSSQAWANRRSHFLQSGGYDLFLLALVPQLFLTWAESWVESVLFYTKEG